MKIIESDFQEWTNPRKWK